jgi:hypothetical protein
MQDVDRDIYLCDQSSRGPASIQLGGRAAAGSLGQSSTCSVKLIWREEWKGGQRCAGHRAIVHCFYCIGHPHSLSDSLMARSTTPSTDADADATGLDNSQRKKSAAWYNVGRRMVRG